MIVSVLKIEPTYDNLYFTKQTYAVYETVREKKQTFE